jgi:hypothetical protein
MSSYEDRGNRDGAASPSPGKAAHAPLGSTPGKTTLVENLPQGAAEAPSTVAMDRAVADGGEVPYRTEMEHAFGQDFGSVRAKVGASAALGEIGAMGAARDEEIAFASPSPDRGVVAHELAHVVQRRRAGSGKASTPLEDAGSSAEQEAEHVATRVAAGERAPQVTQSPTGAVARTIPSRSPPPPPQVTASQWIDHMLVLSPLRAEVASHLVSARMPVVHPRLTWNAAAGLPLHVWGSVRNVSRLQLVVAPFDILARVDQMRELGDAKGKVTVGPLTYVPEVATIIAREIENAVGHSVQRLGPRLVAAYDASIDPWAGKHAARDAATVPADAIVVSHPLDRIVKDLVHQGSFATIRPRTPDDAEPAPDRVVPGKLRAITYRWAEDPTLWNWIHTEPADATAEEVAKQVLGSTARAYELRGPAPFFALPADHVKRIAPDRAAPAALKVSTSVNQPGFHDAAEELNHGVAETALARSKVGEEAALAQAGQAGDGAVAAKGDTDASALAARCHAQVHLITDSYPQLGAGPKLAPMAGRLAGRARRLQTMPAADYARFGKLFAQQSSVLYAVAGDLETIAGQARKLQHASGATTVDPTLAEIADLLLEAGASSDLPATARKQLELAHARHAAIPFDAMDAMLDDARARTIATDSLAENWGPGDSGSTKASSPAANSGAISVPARSSSRLTCSLRDAHTMPAPRRPTPHARSPSEPARCKSRRASSQERPSARTWATSSRSRRASSPPSPARCRIYKTPATACARSQMPWLASVSGGARSTRSSSPSLRRAPTPTPIPQRRSATRSQSSRPSFRRSATTRPRPRSRPPCPSSRTWPWRARSPTSPS